MAQVNTARVTPMFTTDSNMQIRIAGPSLVDSHLQELSNAVTVQGLKRIVLQYPVRLILTQKALAIITTYAGRSSE